MEAAKIFAIVVVVLLLLAGSIFMCCRCLSTVVAEDDQDQQSKAHAFIASVNDILRRSFHSRMSGRSRIRNASKESDGRVSQSSGPPVDDIAVTEQAGNKPAIATIEGLARESEKNGKKDMTETIQMEDTEGMGTLETKVQTKSPVEGQEVQNDKTDQSGGSVKMADSRGSTKTAKSGGPVKDNSRTTDLTLRVVLSDLQSANNHNGGHSRSEETVVEGYTNAGYLDDSPKHGHDLDMDKGQGQGHGPEQGLSQGQGKGQRQNSTAVNGLEEHSDLGVKYLPGEDDKDYVLEDTHM